MAKARIAKKNEAKKIAAGNSTNGDSNAAADGNRAGDGNGAGDGNEAGDGNGAADDGATDGNNTKKEKKNGDETKRLRSLDADNGGCVPIPDLGITCPDLIADGNKNDDEPAA